MWLVVDIPILPAAAWVEEIAAGYQIGMSIAIEDVKSLTMTVDLAVFALFG